MEGECKKISPKMLDTVPKAARTFLFCINWRREFNGTFFKRKYSDRHNSLEPLEQRTLTSNFL